MKTLLRQTRESITMFATTRSQAFSSPRSGTVRRVGLLAVGCLVALALLTSDALAGQLPVPLGAASSYAALAGSTVTSTGPTTLNGDLGVWPGTSPTGFPPGMVTGAVHAGDRFAMHAQGDLTAAYNDAAGRQPPQALPADVGGRTLAPGVYKTGATPALGLTGTLTLDGQGDPNAVFIFQVGSALTTSVASRVNLIGGAQSCNVFWQIGSSATLGTSSGFAGSILALSSISMNDGVTLNGRALARNGAVTLINDTITAPHCTTGPTPGGPAGGGTTGGPTIPGGPTGGPTIPGGPTGRPTIPGGTTGGDTRPPTPPLLLSPRAHARVRAGIVNFSWRPAARAQRYTLIVDHHRMNTGPRTRAAMRVRLGSHRYQVIAQNRYGARSSRHRSFSAAKQATKSPSPGPLQAASTRLRRALALLSRRVSYVLVHPSAQAFAQADSAVQICAGAVAGAVKVGLTRVASRYARLCSIQVNILSGARGIVRIVRRVVGKLLQALRNYLDQAYINDLLNRAMHYGTQEAHRRAADDPNLTPVQLGRIEENAADWYGENELLRRTLGEGVARTKGGLDFVVKPGDVPDDVGRRLFEALKVGGQRLPRSYSGRAGIWEIPGKTGELDGGTIGFRTAAETKSGKATLDINTPETGPIKIKIVKP